MKTQAPMAQALYGTLFDNPFDGLAYCQMFFDGQDQPVDFVYVKVSKNFEKLTGLKEAEGKKVTELIPGIKTSNPELFEIYGRVSLTGQSERFEVYIQPLARWFLVSVYSSQKKFFLAIFQNITDQKQMEQDLRNVNIAIRNVLEDLKVEKEILAQAEAKDEAILASIGDAVMVCDKDGRVTLFNTVAEVLSGFSAKEAIGHHYSQSFKFIRESDEKSGNDFIAETIKIGQGKKMENHILLITKGGRKIPVADSAAPIKNTQGEIIGCVLVFRDITKDREIDKAKTEFVSLASHQLRTPLGIMKWYLEVLQKEDYLQKAPQQTKEYFDEVSKSNERVLALVRDLLSVSRIEQGRVKNEPKPVNIPEIITDVVTQLQILAKSKKVTLYLELKAQKLPSMYLDPLRFHEVIENLVTNAIEYTPALGKVEVIVDENNDMVTVSIQDTGMGISAEDKSKLFYKFFRSQEAIKSNPEGSGLGLYVVKSYVEGWGGKISVESVEGKGSTFVVSLPISQKKNV